jgi:hypothetical protein
VGTQRKPGQAITLARRTPGFALRPTLQGVLLDPVADTLDMRATAEGFVVTAQGRSLSLTLQDDAAAAEGDAASFSRRFDWPALPPADLLRRLERAIAGASEAPAQARSRERISAAQSMLALGLGPEAQALLQVTLEDAPREADNPDVIALSAIAAMLAGRFDEAAGIDDPRLTGTDEIALWRAVRASAADPASPNAAAVFASELPLIRAYPEPLRTRLLPRALQTMALGGQAAAVLHALPAEQTDPAMQLARAIALDVQAKTGGDSASALSAYDKLAASNDRSVSTTAADRATELRLRAGKMTPAEAADALEHTLFAWRGDDREPNLRMRIAELRRQAGAWRSAIAELREVDQGWPERHDAVKSRLSDIFQEALAKDAEEPLAPLDFVTLVEENPDLVPGGEAGRTLAAHIADRLVALDLPKRATVALERVAAATPPGAARAEIGECVAILRLQQSDAPGALTALDQSEATDLPQNLQDTRGITRARAVAAQGDLPTATAMLARIGTPAAEDVAASMFEAAKDWPAAFVALKPYVADVVPDEGPLNDVQARALLRLASVAAQLGDEKTLERLRAHDVARLPSGPLSEMMTLLTEQPVRGVSDLGSVSREAALIRGLPGALDTLGASVPQSRPSP